MGSATPRGSEEVGTAGGPRSCFSLVTKGAFGNPHRVCAQCSECSGRDVGECVQCGLFTNDQF